MLKSTSQDTAEIARGLRHRDPGALDLLIERYQYRLMRYLVYLTGQREVAEDLFQETWIRVMERGRQYNGKTRFEAWLFAVARHLFIDWVRKRKPVSLQASGGDIEVEESLALASTQRSSPFELVARSEDAETLTQTLQDLHPLYREVLVLRFQEELPLAEIAEVVGAPLSTVKSRLYRGLRKMRSRLEEEGS